MLWATLSWVSTDLPKRTSSPSTTGFPWLISTTLTDTLISFAGTWQTLSNLPASSLIPITSTPALSPAQLSTLSINPPTALRMLSDFVPLNPDSPAYSAPSKKPWVIQNGANSAVGISAIQLCKQWGVGTINLVRDRRVGLRTLDRARASADWAGLGLRFAGRTLMS